MKLITTIISLLLVVNVTLAQTTITGTINSGGLIREYRAYIPAIYNNAQGPVPLVFNLHGYTSNNIEQEFYGDFRPIADTANFIIVHPNGTFDNSNERFWNTFDGGYTVDDVAFLSDLIDSLSATYNIDPNRIYSTGMSNGGFMSYELACFLSNRIAAVASVTGSMVTSRLTTCNPSHPMPIMEIHGDNDAVVAYNGALNFESIENVLNYWVEYNECTTSPTITQVPNVVVIDNCTAEHYVYGSGTNGSRVEHYKIINGGHTWPGAPINLSITNLDFEASNVIWDFFRQFQLNTLTPTNDLSSDETIVNTIVPNPSDGDFTISFADENAKSISVCNAMGQIISVQPNVIGRSATIRVNNKGVYWITVRQAKKVFSSKIIKL